MSWRKKQSLATRRAAKEINFDWIPGSSKIWINTKMANNVCYTYSTYTVHEYSRHSEIKGDKATQHNTNPETAFFPKKKSCTSGETRTHASRILGVMLYRLSYRGSSAGCVQITHTTQSKARQSKCLKVNSNLV